MLHSLTLKFLHGKMSLQKSPGLQKACRKYVVLLITFQVAHTIDLRHEDSARLTQYIGAGYDILQGNPEAEDRFDPGFKHPVFQLSYNQGKKTNDRKYEVPDRTYARDSRSCNF